MRNTAVAAITIGLSASIVLAGCSNTPSSSSASGGSGGTLQVATVSGGDGDAMKAVTADFQKKTGITVKLTTADTDAYQTTLRTQLSSGTGPDVFFAWPGIGNPMATQLLAKAGLIKDLSGSAFVKDVPEAYQGLTQYKGKTYVQPETQALIGYTVNEQTLKGTGLTVPDTFTGVLDFCKAAKAKGKVAFSLGDSTNWNTQLIPYALVPTLVYGPDPTFATQQSSGAKKFVGSGWSKAFDGLLKMQQAGCFQKNPLGTSYEDSLALVAKGQAIGTVSVNASTAAIKTQAASDATFKTYPLPADDDTSSTKIAAALGAGYAINAKAKNSAAADRFLKYLSSDAVLAKYSSLVAGLPALPSSSFKLDPSLSLMNEYLTSNKFTAFPDQQWPNSKVQQVHFTVLEQLLAGKTNVSSALGQMDAAYAEGAN